jgi:hypothetical protein
VACQTCHIPIYSKQNPTKVYWDWSTAGQDMNRSKDKYGKSVYDKNKGSFPVLLRLLLHVPGRPESFMRLYRPSGIPIKR